MRQQAGRHHEARPDPQRHHGRDGGGDGGDDGKGQRVHTGRERRVALDELEVLGDQEDEPEEAEEGDRDGDRSPAEAWDGEDPHVEQGPLGPQLEQREDHQEDGGNEEAGQRARRRPAPLWPLDDAQHQHGHAGGREQDAPDVEGVRGDPGQPRDEQLPRDQRDDHDRDVDEEDGAVPEVLEQCPTGDGAEGDRDARGGAPDAECLLPLGRVVEDARQDRQAGREDERRGHTHERPGGDQGLRRVRRGGGRREQPEEHEAHLHGPLATEAVPDAAPRQQQTGEGEAVGVNDPLQGRDRGAEVSVQRGQRHVDDGVVDHHQEHGEAQDGEDQPAAVARDGKVGHGGAPFSGCDPPGSVPRGYRTLC